MRQFDVAVPFRGLLACLAALTLVASGCSSGGDHGKSADFGRRIAEADTEPGNWLSTGRGYDETHYSPLDQISSANIGRLKLAWSYDLDTNRGQESTPLEVDGTLYTTSAWSKVQAFDVKSGKLLWQFDPRVPGAAAVKACCDVVNRGAAFWDGKVYVGTIDGRLIAIDARTGKQLWSAQTTDPHANNTITGAPRVVKGRVIIGNGGAELGARGYFTAYDAETGARVWRFYTVPGDPAKPDGDVSDKPLRDLAAKTWAGKWWSREDGGGGGGTVWDSMAYDPALDLLYIGVGNASYWNKAYRSPGDGDNLFVGSVLAVRPETGEYVWHYQETPGDEWDYTSTQNMILTDLTINGKRRHVLLHAPKNGYFYVLDRATGKVLSAKPYIPLTWSTGFDMKTGRPQINPAARYDRTGKAWIAMPGSYGGHNWQPMSYSKLTGLVYIPVQEVPALYKPDPEFKRRRIGMNLGIDLNALMLPDDPKARAAALKIPKAYLLAWDPIAQKSVWKASHSGFPNGGVLSTAGNLVFQGDIDGRFNAYDSRTGQKLWSFDAQTQVAAAPVSYAVDGVQYVSVVVGLGGTMGMVGGEAMWDAKGPRVNKSRVLTFAIDGKAPPLPPLNREAAAPLDPPAQFADAGTIERGRMIYLNTCAACHGGNVKTAGIVPDLRRSAAIADKQTFYAIVGEGALASQGMVSFKDNYSPAQIEAIRAFIIARAQHDKAAGDR